MGGSSSTDEFTRAVLDKMEAQYSAAKERCDAMTGSAKDTCLNDAKKKFGKM